jgi:phosphoribosylformylglycinamidine synthase
LLLEATLEAISGGYVVGIQDMGAAGITCSTAEMSARGRSGMKIDLELVPTRESGMSAYEIMLSESQERMLVVVKPEHEGQVRAIFEKWDLACRRIGSVERSGSIEVWKAGGVVAKIPAENLVLGGGAPVYIRESREPEYLKSAHSWDPASVGEPKDYVKTLERLLASPNICSRAWITMQYDSMVRTNTIVHEKSDAAVVRIKGTDKALALKTDCNSRYVYLNPYVGAMIAVAECARNVVCTGGVPLAITNCLNFGNPYKPEVYWQFKESVRGIGDACRALGTPVTGGNVSFYNESPEGPIFPTPVIGMLGEVPSLDRVTTAGFKRAGDLVLLIGETAGHLGGSEYLKLEHGLVAGDAPPLDLATEKSLQDALRELIAMGMIHSAHDLSEGGLGVALAECCIWSEEGLGADIEPKTGLRLDRYLFGEDQSRVIVSTAPQAVPDVKRVLEKHGQKFFEIGKVTRGPLQIGAKMRLEVPGMREVYEGTIPALMKE